MVLFGSTKKTKKGKGGGGEESDLESSPSCFSVPDEGQLEK